MTDKEVRIKIVIDNNGAQAALSGIADDMKKVKDAAENTGTSVGGFNSAVMSINNAYNQVSGAIGVLASGFKSIGDAIHAGEDVGAVSAAFVAISGSAQEAARTLELMNAATGNTISNMQLMQTASRMFSMGLASSGDEAARLTELAVKLGGAMGNDATSSIENFTMLLANQSVRRLDTFGLSVDAVKARMEQLKAQGISTQEAFTMAVMEQGAAKLKTLGDAANASLTPLKQLEKTIGDVKDNLLEMGAANVNSFLDKAVSSLAYAQQQSVESYNQQKAAQDVAIEREQKLKQAIEETNNEIQDRSNAGAQYSGFSGQGMDIPQFGDPDRAMRMMEAFKAADGDVAKFADLINESQDRAQGLYDATDLLSYSFQNINTESADFAKNLQQAQTHQSVMDAMGKSHYDRENAQDAIDQQRADADAKKRAIEEAKQALKDMDTLVKQTNEDFKGMGKDFKGQKVFSPEDVALIKDEAQFTQDYFDTYIKKGYEAGTITKEQYEASLKQVDALKELAVNAANTGDAYKEMNNAISDAKMDMRGIGKMKSQAGDFASKEGAQFQGLTLFDDKEIAKLDQYKSSVDETLARVEEAHSQGLITDQDYENAKKSADAVSKLADDAHRSAEAFSKMNLNQLMGQVDGGVVGEIGDKILANFKGSAKDKAALEQKLGLASGEVTQTSIAMDDVDATLAKLAKSKGGQDKAVDATLKIAEYLKQSAVAGLDDAAKAEGLKALVDQLTVTKNNQVTAPGDVAGFDVQAYIQMIQKFGHAPNMAELAASQKQDKQAIDQSSALAGMDSEYLDTKGGKGKGKGKDDKSAVSEETKAMVKDTEQIKLNNADSAKSLGISEAHLAAGKNHLKSMVQDMTALTSKSHKVDLEIVLSGKAAGLLDQLLALNKGNGGVAPGTSPRGSNPWKD